MSNSEISKKERSSSIFTSSISSFTENALLASTFSKMCQMPPTSSLIETFIEFLQLGTKEVIENMEKIENFFIELCYSVNCIQKQEEYEDVYLISLCENLYHLLINVVQTGNEQTETQYEISNDNRRTSMKERENYETSDKDFSICSLELKTRELISKIIFLFFNGENKQIFANVALKMDESSQNVLMELIQKETEKEKEKDITDSTLEPNSNEKTLERERKSMRNLRNPKISQFSSKNDQIFKYIHKMKNSENEMDIEITLNNETLHSNFLHEEKSQESNINCTGELVERVLILEEENEYLNENIKSLENKLEIQESDLIDLQTNNKELEEMNKDLTEKLAVEIQNNERIETNLNKEMQNRERRWQNRMKILEKNRQQQIAELIELNNILNKQFEDRISEYENKMEIKREKIQELQESLEISENSLKQYIQNCSKLEKTLKSLESELEEKDKCICELEILKDEMNIELQIRNSRIEDMKLLLSNEIQKYSNKKIMTQITKCQYHSGNDQCCDCQCVPKVSPHLFSSLMTEEWQNQSQVPKPEKLVNNLRENNWGDEKIEEQFTEQFSDLEQIDWNIQMKGYYSDYISYLSAKNRQLEKCLESTKELRKENRDLKYENKKLIQSLLEHESYRGEENEIVIGCLFELREQINSKEFQKVEDLDDKILTQRINRVYEELKSDRSFRAELSNSINGRNFIQAKDEAFPFSKNYEGAIPEIVKEKDNDDSYVLRKGNEKMIRKSCQQQIRSLKFEVVHKSDKNILSYFKEPSKNKENKDYPFDIPHLPL